MGAHLECIMFFFKPILLFHVAVFVLDDPMIVFPDYTCYCSYENQQDVFDNLNTTGLPIGFIHLGDCLPQSNLSTDNNSSLPVDFNGEIGFMKDGPNVILSTCLGYPPPAVIKADVTNTPLRFLGIGYNLLTGNPTSSPDTGLLMDKRILTFTSIASQIREASVSMSASCTRTVSHYLVHGSRSLQEELKTQVHASVSHPTRIIDNAFIFNRDIHSLKANLESGQIIYHDAISKCRSGAAYFHGNLQAHGNIFSISDEFVKAFCHLPFDNSSASSFMQFFEDWGTSVVMSAEFGTLSLSRFGESLAELFQRVHSGDQSLLVHSGWYNGYSSSYVFDSSRYNASAAMHEHLPQHVAMETGSTSDPAPIAFTIVPITDVISSDYFLKALDKLLAQQICRGEIFTRGKDVITRVASDMLETYSEYKLQTTQYSNARTDFTLQVPVTWPTGTYGMMKTSSGCPTGGAAWQSGWRYQDTEDQSPSNQYTAGIEGYLAGSFANNNLRTEFCMKTQAHFTDFDVNWPSGTYCILKQGSCPPGFQIGYLYWDDDDDSNKNGAGGTLPDGSYTENTGIYYCCRNDGSPYSSITLPTDRPFVLVRYGDTCQAVHGMHVRELFLRWDDEDTNNQDSGWGIRPFDDGGGNNHALRFCYYYSY
ncbi:uncharacterized protein LOC127837669 [Dreissena polymorpha]|nr:uncharacterized protein LOC127837669 [Dreissena polymorpha]